MDQQVFDELRKHERWVRRLAVTLVGDADADDTVQDVWVAAIRQPPDDASDDGGSFRRWLMKATRNVARSKVRSRQRRIRREVKAALGLPDVEPSYEHVIACQEQLRAVLGYIAELEEPFRSTLLLHYAEGIELPEIARRLRLPRSTVRWRIFRARQKLRRSLDDRYGTDRWHVAFAPALLLGHRRQAWPSRTVSRVGAVAAIAAVAVISVAWRETGAARIRRSATVHASHLPIAAPGTRTKASATIEAFVEDAEGIATTGAQVTAMPRGRGAARQRTALVLVAGSRAGAYTATLPAGEYDVVATRPGAAPAYALARASNGASVRLRLRLGPEAVRVQGLVTDRAGAPIPNATVVARDQSEPRAGWEPQVRTESDEAGRYELDLTRGAYRLDIAHGGYAPVRRPLLLVDAATVDVVLDPGAQVFGRAVDPAGAPIVHGECVVTTADRRHEVLQGGETDESGGFRFTELPAADVRVLVRSGEAIGESAVVRAFATEAASTGPVVVAPESAIVGVVTRRGRPVEGASVWVADGALRLPTFEPASTDASGRFRVDGVWPGVHGLAIDAGEAGSGTRFVRAGLPGAAPAEVAIELGELDASVARTAEDARVDGIALRRDGAPAPGATVVSVSGDRIRVTKADASGRWSLRVPAGATELRLADGTGRLPAQTDRPTAPLDLRPGERRTGVHVIAWDGSPESDEVGARPGDEPTELRLGFSRWPRAGEITVTILRSDVAFDVLHVRDPSIPNPLTHLPAGAYVVRAVQTSATGCRLASTTVRLASGRATEVELQPIDGAVVSGAAPLDGATVPREALVELVTGTHVDDVPLGGDGRFVAECVPANATTRVQLVRSGVAPSAAREVSTSPGFLELGLLGRAGGRAPLGLNVSPSPNGLVVVHVAPGSAADEVRIAPQDRIELIDGHSVAELARDEVRALLGSSRTLRLGLVDAQGRRRTAELELGSP